MEGSLYSQYRDKNPDRFRVGNRLSPVTDHQGRTRKNVCFGCIVDTDLKETCAECRNENKSNDPVQSKLGF